MKKEKLAWRQGDIVVLKIDYVPNEKNKIDHNGVLAYGEATGHSHRLIPGPKSEVRFFRNQDVNMFEVVTGYADLIHEGHFGHRFETGMYRWHQEREADWLNEVTRNVQD